MPASRPTVPGYDVVELLGFGATGEVWLAREEATGEPVALKRARPSGDLPAARDRMRREAAVLLGIDHPHLVRLRTLVPAGEDVILVLDHAAGGSLAALLRRRGPLLPGEVVTTAAPLAQALAAVHGRGVLHGDVTPANVLFTADGRPLLSDLGVARLIGEPLAHVAVTEGYADPAVLHGDPPSAASDVHGLGAVCFAALTGTAPYAGGVRRDLRELAPDVPAELVDAVEAALERDPDRRPSAAALAGTLFDAAPALPVRLRRASEHTVGVPPADALDAAFMERLLTQRVARPAAEPLATAGGGGRRRRAGAKRAGRWAGKVRTVSLRPVLLALSGVVLLALAATAGVMWAGAGGDSAARAGAATRAGGPAATTSADPLAPTTAAPTPEPTAGSSVPPVLGSAGPPAALSADAEEGWLEVVDALYARRSQAFATGERALLEQVYVVGSPDLNGNLAVFDELIAAQAHTPDLMLDAISAEVAGRAGGRVMLTVVDELLPYRVLDAEGRELRTGPARGPQTVRVELALVDGAWRVASTTLPP